MFKCKTLTSNVLCHYFIVIIVQTNVIVSDYAFSQQFFITVLIIASVAVLALSILTESSDGRKQIIDRDGGSEEKLCSMLSGIKGAGEVEAMVQYNEDSSVSGVIVIAEGGSDPVIANDITKGVSTLYNIPVSSVIVFEKEQEE